MAELTPMMKQYLEIKRNNPDSILFFRLGDFYEMFADDAKTASRELDLALTTRDRGKHLKPEEDQVPMCGIPYHASEAYIARLIAKGYKVAICEQVEDPAKAKGLVKRDIIRVVTPGTVINSACLEDKTGNYLCGVYLDAQGAGVAFCDISTGKTHLTGFAGRDRVEHVINELGRFSPKEAILNDGAFNEPALMDALRDKLRCMVENGGEGRFRLAEAEKNIRKQFGEEVRLPERIPAAAMALGGLLSYLYETQKTDLSHIRELDCYEEGRFMELDLTARRNLELTETLRGKEKKGSLLWVLDRTKTPMGGRCLRSWLERPLLSVTAIRQRNHAVAALVEDTVGREELIAAFTGMGDMERQIGRVVYGTAGGRDMVALRNALDRLPEIKSRLQTLGERRLTALAESLDTLEDIRDLIGHTISDDPPFSVREGGFIRDGWNAEVDRLRHILTGGKGVITEIETREKERTGIRTLKIGYNKVFGYYIEVSNAFRDQVPDTYIRKQTLAGGERYITQELKDLEQEILTADQRLTALEYELFTALREAVTAAAPRIQSAAAAVAETDALCSLASLAVYQNYCQPEVDESGVIEIREGRHPVVERMLKDSLFVPNDTFMGEQEQRVAIITGPNMAGKSTYMRQVALIVLLAQMGSFVPAKYARIGVVDRIFTRIGASDDLAAGQSTFMVEMTEVADILRQATRNSLLILDEIGRGTSTFDGMSIARAVLEHCAGKKRAKTLFATHYHELTELENSLPGTVNCSIAVKTRGEDIIFLRKIVPGGADRSYGIEVARLAGLPESVLRRAREILEELEAESAAAKAPPAPREEAPAGGGGPPCPSAGREPHRTAVRYDAVLRNPEQVSLGSLGEQEVLRALRKCQLDALTPFEAMGLLYEWKKKLDP